MVPDFAWMNDPEPESWASEATPGCACEDCDDVTFDGIVAGLPDLQGIDR